MFVIWLFVSIFLLWLTLGSRRNNGGIGGFLSCRRISGLDGSEYLIRRYLLPRNNYLNIYLHTFLGSDDDRALHDHPWYSISLLLKGTLIEHLPNKSRKIIKTGQFSFRSPQFQHRIELPAGQTAVTVFITGPVVRKWGFSCPQGWMAWDKYGRNGGCD